jgi:hypothetical protein
MAVRCDTRPPVGLEHQAHFEILGAGRVGVREFEAARLERLEGGRQLGFPQRRVLSEVLDLAQRTADKGHAGNRGGPLDGRIRIDDDQSPIEPQHRIGQLVEHAHRRMRHHHRLGHGARHGVGLDRQHAHAGGKFGRAGGRRRPHPAAIK